MLDTNTVSYIVNGRSPAARAKLASLREPETACVSTITEAELHYGLSLRKNADELRSSLLGFLARVQVLAWGRDAALAYGDLRARQEAAGNTLGNMDMLIAAHAIATRAVLVSNDKVFRQVSSLAGLTPWATELQSAKL